MSTFGKNKDPFVSTGDPFDDPPVSALAQLIRAMSAAKARAARRDLRLGGYKKTLLSKPPRTPRAPRHKGTRPRPTTSR